MGWHDVGAADGQAPGTGRRVDAGGTPVALFRTCTGWAAFEDRCPHAGAPLSEGVLRDGWIVCSWHGWRFDPATGACAHDPDAPSASRRPVRVDGGRVLVGGAEET